mmetsp:Transcript_22924/g.58297  ORF Transcript_22924/g.58297 Transcript_22924/m.58297 type:complete len:479 (+) Transcript_22924:35-1471(+)
MASVDEVAHGRRRSYHSNFTGVPFFMYADRSLDHSWLAECSGYHEVRNGVRMQNTAEVGAAKVLRRHPMRVQDPNDALLFFVPVLTYVSKWISAPCGNTSSHRQRMAAAAASLSSSPQWQRFQGRDHFFVTTTWSTAKSSFRSQMYELAAPLACGVAGRYKQFCPHACSRRSSALASCTIHAPYAINLHAAARYRRRAQRPILASFSGSFDVCCTGTMIRCRLGDYLMEALDQTDVVVRPSLPSNVTMSKAGACTERALSRLGEELSRRGPNSSVTGGIEARSYHRLLAIDHLRSWPHHGSTLLSASAVEHRRLAEAWREASIGEDAVRADARMMASSVFCFTPAGDTCVAGRFYSAVAAGCIPVVTCKGAPHPVAFEHLLQYEPFWISITTAEWDNAGALLRRLRGMNASQIERYQNALDHHRADVLYDVPNSRVGSNLLDEMMRTCYSKAAQEDFDAHQMCNMSGTPWPPSGLMER